MNGLSVLVKYIPAAWLPYMKTVVTVAGGVISAALAVYPGVSDLHWFVIASAVVTALAVYLVPNVKVTAGTPSQGAAAKPAEAPVNEPAEDDDPSWAPNAKPADAPSEAPPEAPVNDPGNTGSAVKVEVQIPADAPPPVVHVGV